MAALTFAAIDVGSFEVEMGIYEISNRNRIRKLDHIRHVTALGSDTYNNGKISYEMVEELCDVLAGFAGIMKSYKVTEYRAYATSAMREARNNRIVLDQIRVRTGIQVRIISNSEQRSLFDKNLLVTTENLPLGVLRIRGTLQDVNTTVEQYRDLIGEMVDNELENYKKMYLKDKKIKHLIGIGENILYLFRYEDHGKPLRRVTRERFDEFYARLVTMNETQIEEAFGVSREYASLLLPCVVIYKKFLEMTGAEMIWIPGIRLCDGIAAEYAADKKLLKFRHNFDNDIISTSRTMAKRYQCMSRHTETVEKYVLQIFDTMRRYHGMGQRERLLLQIAVLIHACGKFISVRNSNECAYNIIMSTEIIGISHLEREIIANVVRYNIRDFDYNKVRMETELDAVTDSFGGQNEVMLLIAKLTAILRLANSMDRGHGDKLADCKMAVKDGKLMITTDYPGDITLEAVSFEQKAAFFEEIFGIRPVLRHKKYS